MLIQVDYGWVLLLDGWIEMFVDMSLFSFQGIELMMVVYEVIDILVGFGELVIMMVEMVFIGMDVDSMCYQVVSVGCLGLQCFYLDFYNCIFGEVEYVECIMIEDDCDVNCLVILENVWLGLFYEFVVDGMYEFFVFFVYLFSSIVDMESDC